MKHQHECIFSFQVFHTSFDRIATSTFKLYKTTRFYKMLHAKNKIKKKNVSHLERNVFFLGNCIAQRWAHHHTFYTNTPYPFTRNFKWIKYANCEILEMLLLLLSWWWWWLDLKNVYIFRSLEQLLHVLIHGFDDITLFTLLLCLNFMSIIYHITNQFTANCQL